MRRNYRITVNGPLGVLLYLCVLTLWLIAVLFPALVILGIGFYTDTLTKWEVWLVAIIAEGLWLFFTFDD